MGKQVLYLVYSVNYHTYIGRNENFASSEHHSGIGVEDGKT
jgi:hypothetical protein